MAACCMAPSCGGTGSTHLEPREALAGGQQAQPVEDDLQQRGVVLRQAGRGSRAGGVGDVWWQRRWHVLPWHYGATDQACSGGTDLHGNCIHAMLRCLLHEGGRWGSGQTLACLPQIPP